MTFTVRFLPAAAVDPAVTPLSQPETGSTSRAVIAYRNSEWVQLV
ncbi:hypothetical protein [Paenibacillus cremeus]|nr:hypothetical protein [Paenibacillus cremeus]